MIAGHDGAYVVYAHIAVGEVKVKCIAVDAAAQQDVGVVPRSRAMRERLAVIADEYSAVALGPLLDAGKPALEQVAVGGVHRCG